MMEELELEEGEACSYDENNNHDGSIDPDKDLSYIDEKIQNVLGHFQKDFEGGVSAENLGAKFGGYGSFLPTYQRSPVLSCPKTPMKTQNSSISPNNLLGEHVYAASSSVLKTVRPGPSSSSVTSLSAPKPLSSNISAKQKPPLTSTHMETSSSPRQKSSKKKSSVLNKQNSLKFRLKVGPEILHAEKNAEIYSGLGLEVSPSSSLDVSTSESEDMYSEPKDLLLESPSRIITAMTAYPLDEEPLLSPLGNDLVFFSEKKVLEENKCIPISWIAPESSHIMVNGSDSGKADEKLSSDKKSMKRINGLMQTKKFSRKNHPDENGSVGRTNSEQDTLFQFTGDTGKGIVDVPNESELVYGMARRKAFDDAEKGLSSQVFVKEPVLDEDPRTSSAGSVQEGTKEAKKYDKYKGGKVSGSFGKSSSVFKGTNLKIEPADCLRKDREEGTEFGGKKKLKETQKSSVLPKIKKKPKTDLKSQKDVKKAEEAYKDFFGDMGESEEEDAKDHQLKGSKNSRDGTCAVDYASARSLLNSHLEAVPNDAPPSSNKPISDAVHANSNPLVIKENWVGCDKCGKWRLLPPGILPENLPDKWMCFMLDWLPGKNNCNVPEDETTNPVMLMYQVPAPECQGIMQSNPVGAISQTNPEADVAKMKKKGLVGMSCEAVKEGLARHVSTREGKIIDPDFAIRPSRSGDSAVKRYKHKQKEKLKVVDHLSDQGNTRSLKMKNKRDVDRDEGIILSKKMKMENFLFSDEDQVSEHGGASRNRRPSSSSGVPTSSAGRDWPRHSDHPRESHSDRKPFLQTSSQRSKDIGSIDVGNSDYSGTKRKRKVNEGQESQLFKEELSESENRKEKKARGLKNEIKESSYGKNNSIAERKSVASSKREIGVPHNSAAATSSSSKISDSHRMKASFHEAKGSPVESVSSSPIRVLDPEKVMASGRRKKDESRVAIFCAPASLRRSLDGENDGRSDRLGMNKEDKTEFAFLESHSGKAKDVFEPSIDVKKASLLNAKYPSSRKEHSRDEGRQSIDHRHSNGSRKSEKSSSRSKDKSQRKSDSKEDPGNTQKKSIGKFSSENGKTQSLPSLGGRESTNTNVDKSLKANIIVGYDSKESSNRIASGKREKAESVSERETSRPPTKRLQDEIPAHSSVPAPVPNKADITRKLGDGSSQVDVVSKTPIQMPHNGNLDQSLQIGHSPSPLRPEPASSQAASNALREAKDLKHMADRLKKNGSTLENIGYYFEACLKFLHGASILESCGSENAKDGEMVQSVGIYSSTAKLLGFCAYEYEKLKATAAAALAYKCMEVAYMRVVYSSHTNANRCRHELQTSLQMAPSGDSPSSSASDVDNLNPPAIADKVGTSKCINSPQVAGNHVISARNRPNLLRLLHFAQDVNFAMDASRKSRTALTASQHVGDLSSIQRALDYNFQDVPGLLHLVRLAMKTINR